MGLIIVGMAGLVYLFFKKGPYHEATYQDKMILSSFWGKRPLNDEMREEHSKEFSAWLEKDTEETRLYLI